MARQIFRQKALDQLAAPEQLDHLMQVTSPRLWVALLALLLLMLAALFWGFKGSVPTTVNAQGILLSKGALTSVVTLNSGVIEQIDVQINEFVQKGQVVARLFQQAGDKQAGSQQITSPFSGEVTEIYKSPGMLINQGETLLVMERGNSHDNLSIVAYFSPYAGKQIQAGMLMGVTPAVVRREEHGFILAEVTQVANFPASAEGMLQVLRNPGLVKKLSEDSAPIMVRATLQTSPDTPSGYRWSSGNGPDIQIHSGTLSSVNVIVKQQPPITLVLPFLKRFLFGAGDASRPQG